MKKILLFVTLILVTVQFSFSQIGGENTYEFLDLSPSARVTALGGAEIGTLDDDASFSYQNPSLLNPSMHSQVSINTVAYPGGINHGYVGYVHDFDSLLTAGLGLQYISYGNFALTDPTGLVLGDFSGGEMALTLGGARKWKRISYGANLKVIFSHLETYNSFGLAADLGATYHHPEKEWGLALVVKNLGTQLSTYDGVREDLPFDVQLGFSKKLQYLPLRISIVATNLHRWDIRYDDPNVQTTSIFGEEEPEESSHFVDIFFRHLVFSGELYLGKNVQLRAGYNHLRRQELSVSNKRSFSGFTFGGGVKISKFHISYGFASYHVGAAAHHFSINSRISDFVKK